MDANTVPERRSGAEPKAGRVTRARYDASEIETIRREWWPWCRGLTSQDQDADVATDQVITYLQTGLPAETVASLIRIRVGLQDAPAVARVAIERTYCETVHRDVADLLARHVISPAVAATLDHEFDARLAALSTSSDRIASIKVPAPTPAFLAEAPAAAPGTPAAPLPAAPPSAPIAPPISLRDLFAEHSVLILASLGAFLLVVATVLFELYGTVGLGGGARLAAVVALNVVFAGAGFLANRQERLRSVGRIYIGLAAVLLPLVGLAAWTFLALGARGITVDQALAITGGTCALVYGFLARKLGFRLYGEMAGVAILVASWGISGAIAGHHWRPVGLALTPLVYAAWERLLPDRAFSHFPWFAHASVLVALGDAFRFGPGDWLWTATLVTVAAAYLVWQALAAHRSRAWAGEAALVAAAATASGPLGVSSNHFVLPMLVAIPLLVLARVPNSLGAVGRLYHAHPAHLHLAVLAGFALAVAEDLSGEVWPMAISLWIAVGLYLADFWLGRTEIAGYAVRAALVVGLAATAEAWGLGPWGATLTAAALIAYVVPFFAGPSLKPLTAHASLFFYGGLAPVAVQLAPAQIGGGHWEIPAALLVSAVAFGAASEKGAVRMSPYAARGLFSLAWFGGVDALNAQGWRGPFDRPT